MLIFKMHFLKKPTYYIKWKKKQHFKRGYSKQNHMLMLVQIKKHLNKNELSEIFKQTNDRSYNICSEKMIPHHISESWVSFSPWLCQFNHHADNVFVSVWHLTSISGS